MTAFSMKKIIFGLLLLTAPTSVSFVVSAEPVDYVNPFIGTKSGRWFFFTPAAMPFGLAKLAPDTYGYGGYVGGGEPSGYRYHDSSIIGFSHLHEFQLGGFLLMPTTGHLLTIPGEEGKAGWRSHYSKATEVAEPGYYRVLLEKYDTKVELTATSRAGFHRYTFPATESARVIFDVGRPLGEAGAYQKHDDFRAALRGACIERVDDKTLRAYVTIAPQYAEQAFTIYAFLRFNRPFQAYGAYRGESVFPGRDQITGFGSGYYVEFDASADQVVETQVGLSLVSVEQAKENLSTEVGELNFDEIRRLSRSAWNTMLGRVEIAGDLPEERDAKIKLYTALWHVLLGRGVSSDADGSYLDSSGHRRQIPVHRGQLEFERYNTDALWGSFWNLNQVWALLYPERMTSFSKFLLSVYKETGWLPDGFVGNQRAPGMLSNQTTPFLAAAYARTPDAFDKKTLWAAIKKNQTEWRERPRFTGKEVLAGYTRLGYAPCDDVGYGPTGHSLEYAFEDWCAAQVALQMKMPIEAKFMMKRSENWRNHWDFELNCFRPRKYSGSFYEPFDMNSGYSFAEGTARQYRWFVPHDLGTLVKLFGEAEFLSELQLTLSEAERTDFGPVTASNTAGYSMGYNHGNQPDLHVAWLFHAVNRPELSQYFVHAICSRFYGLTPDHGYGLSQDEDQGQLGAWYVLAALGLFDVEGGVRRDGDFFIIPPLFKNVKLHLGGVSPRVLNIKSADLTSLPWEARFNDKLLPDARVSWREILSGGRLEFAHKTQSEAP
jgi:predicted alpha-1,2-mannosidase